jgi:hypothetical protein
MEVLKDWSGDDNELKILRQTKRFLMVIDGVVSLTWQSIR